MLENVRNMSKTLRFGHPEQPSDSFEQRLQGYEETFAIPN